MSYATPKEAAEPCPASWQHSWVYGLIEEVPFGEVKLSSHDLSRPERTEHRIITYVCMQCLLELHNSDIPKFRELLIIQRDKDNEQHSQPMPPPATGSKRDD